MATATTHHRPSRQSLYPSLSLPHQTTTTSTSSFNAAPSTTMADSLPQINFNFEDLRERMTKFTARFDNYISESRKQVLDERNEFRGKVTELDEDHKLKERSLEILSHQTTTHQSTLAKESAETSDLVQSIDSLTLQREKTTAQRDTLLAQIKTTQSQISARVAAQAAHAAKLDELGKFNVPELDFWVDYLCMRIEGVVGSGGGSGSGGQDCLRFVFSHLDERSWEREASFELVMGSDAGGHEYSVRNCRPKVDKDRLLAAVDKVNEGRDFKEFLKSMRGLLGEVMK